MSNGRCEVSLSCISLLLFRLPILPSQCYANGLGNLGSLGSSKKYSLREYSNSAVSLTREHGIVFWEGTSARDHDHHLSLALLTFMKRQI